MLLKVYCGLGLALSMVLAGCYSRAIPAAAPADEIRPDQASANVEDDDKPGEPAETDIGQAAGLTEAELLAPQATVLVAEDPDAQINMRAGPSAEAAVIDVGVVGDEGVASSLVTAEDGYGWYYIRLDPGERSGWVRDDFVDVVGVPMATAVVTDDAGIDVLSTALDNYCGGPQSIEAYYGTASFIVYICRLRDRPIYISNEIGTPQVLVTEAVERDAAGAGYIARQDNYEYHISGAELVVYRIGDQGTLAQVLQERVTTTQHY
jgi:hypothetical protein